MHYFIFTLLIFSVTEVISKPLMDKIDPFLLTFYRFLMGFIVMFIFVTLRNNWREVLSLKKKEVMMLVLMGFLNIFLSMSMLQLAVKHGTAATAAVIFCSNPMFVLLIMILKGRESASIRNFAPIIMAITGTYFIMTDSGEFSLSSGAIYALISALSFAVYSVISKGTLTKLSVSVANLVSFFAGITFSATFILISGIGFDLSEFFVSDGVVTLAYRVTAFIYMGVLLSGFGYLALFKTLKKFSALSSSYIFLLKPLIATTLSIIFLAEPYGMSFWLGLCFIVAAMAIVLLPKKTPIYRTGPRI